MKKFRILILFTLVIALTVGAGAVAGVLGHRWGQPVDLAKAGERINDIPDKFGEWEQLYARPLDDDVVQMLQCAGSTHRRYRNKTTGDVVSFFVIVGPTGPTSVHTPEVCYSSHDYEILSPRKRFAVADVQKGDEGFWGMLFKSNGLNAHLLRVAFAWSDGHGWFAADNPRVSYGGSPLLYKLQLAAPLASQARLAESDPCQAFLKDFLPVLEKVLFEDN